MSKKYVEKYVDQKKHKKYGPETASKKASRGGAKKRVKNGPGRRPKRDVFQSPLRGMPGAFQAACGPEDHEKDVHRTRTNDNDNDSDNVLQIQGYFPSREVAVDL